MAALVPGVYSFCDQHTTQHTMVQAGGQAHQDMHICSLYNMPVSSSMYNNVYDSANRSSISLSNLSGLLCLWSTVGLTEYSSVHTIPGIPDKTIRQGLQGEYMCLDDFLQNYTVNNTEVQDIQS